MRLKDKAILITAAGQGIGRASALACAREGARVFATDINAGLLESLAAGAPGVQTLLLDVRDDVAVAALARTLPALDGLFNCAGFVHEGTILQCDDAAWDFSFDLNVKGAYRVTRAMLPAMRPRSEGVSTVPGHSALQRRPRVTKSAAIALVRPMTAALVAPYAKRLGKPFTDDAIDAMLRMEAVLPGVRASLSSIAGSTARVTR